MKKTVIISLLAISASLCLNACSCGYDCSAACAPSADLLAQIGYNASDNSSGGLDPAEVCHAEALEAATNCEECITAIEDEYRIFVQEVACDCAPLAAGNEEWRELHIADANCDYESFRTTPVGAWRTERNGPTAIFEY